MLVRHLYDELSGSSASSDVDLSLSRTINSKRVHFVNINFDSTLPDEFKELLDVVLRFFCCNDVVHESKKEVSPLSILSSSK